MSVLIFLSVAVLSYYLMSIVQAVLHRDYGHRKRIKAVFVAHAIGHHGQYPAHQLKSDEFVDLESHALNYYGIPIVLIAAFTYFVFGPMVMIAHLVGTFATFRWHIYLHRHYHLTETYLERFAWFRNKRRLHYVHHRDASVNFAVVEFWVDSLLGTRRET